MERTTLVQYSPFSRSQIISLKYSYRKDVDDIQRQINDGLEPSRQVKAVNLPETCSCELAGWRSIGVVNTWFPGRRGVPRQAALSPEAQGVLTLSPTVINNPAFSLSGLEEFSHVWILFHFHQTKGSHIKTKVAPPRLGGARVGVFGTRAPHRPCPIGLSLVKLDRIEGKFYFLISTYYLLILFCRIAHSKLKSLGIFFRYQN